MWATKNKTFRAGAKSRASLRVVQPSSYEHLIQVADLIVVRKKPRFLELREGQATITTFLYEVVGEYAVADFNGLRQVLGPQHKFCVETRPRGGYRDKQPNL